MYYLHSWEVGMLTFKYYTPCLEKRCHFIFDYNFRIFWSIFIIFFTVGNRN